MDIITQLIGWTATAIVLIGFYINTKLKLKPALMLWIMGDVLWIVYDIIIRNYSHSFLCTVIILINLTGLRTIYIKNKQNKKIG